MAVIFWLSSRSDLPAPCLFWGEDKVIHALLFGILGFLFAGSFQSREAQRSWKRVLLSTLLVTLYGLFDEGHQMFVWGRDASLGDVAADTTGGFVASLLRQKIRRRPGRGEAKIF